MKKFITILTAVIMVLAVLTSCSPNSSATSKGNVTNIEFNALFKGIDFDKLCSYALIDHEYTSDDYTVYATYSSGEKENVTAKATIEGEHVKSSAGSLIFSGDTSGVHEFKLKVSYGGKSVSAVVYAYKPGDPIEFEVKQSKFFVGSRLFISIAKIKYLDEDGDLHTGNLPKTGFVTIKDKDEKETKETLEKMRALKDGDVSISYRLYENSEAVSFKIEEILPLSKVKSMNGVFSPNVTIGGNFDTTTFVSTYMKNWHVYLADNEKFFESTVRSYFAVTDNDGKVDDSFAENFKIDVTVTRGNESPTSGTFQNGDVIKIKVTSKSTSSEVLLEKTYTVGK